MNSTYTRDWLIPFFDSLFEMMEREENYLFTLDGQTILIEDYFKELARHGRDISEQRRKIEKYAGEKRLALGPYYLQPDWQLVSDESLVRNLLIGTRMADRISGYMKVGWLLDNFGQISQAPQIHLGFGLHGVFVWRGIEMEPEDVKTEFIWESPDGSKITAIYLLDSYRNAMRLADHPHIFPERIKLIIDRIRPFATTSNVLLMNGYDQEMAPDDILPLLKELTKKGTAIKQTTPEDYIAEIEKADPKLHTYNGYFFSGRYISVFPGILSSRMYLKLSNDRCQRLLEKQIEPVSVFSWLNGGEYQTGKIENLWKLLLQNHPHDDICGVSIDDVHLDMEERFTNISISGSHLLKIELGRIASLIDTEQVDRAEGAYILFNPSLNRKSCLVTIPGLEDGVSVLNSEGVPLPVQKTKQGWVEVFAEDVPAFSFKTIYLEKTDKEAEPVADPVRSDPIKMEMENRFLSVKVHENGSLDIFDQKNSITYKGLGVFEDRADAGDTYNYSAPLYDKTILSTDEKVSIEWVERGILFSTLKISIEMKLPGEISKGRSSRATQTMVLPIVTYVRLETGSPVLRFKTFIKNTVKDHRLRVLFPTRLTTDFSYPETQFDVVKHEIHPAPYNDQGIPSELKRVLIGAREPEPVTTFPQRSFVDLTDTQKGFAVLNRGLPEYEITGNENTIALTLVRSVGWLARSDLKGRIGDAGPEIYTPGAQVLRKLKYEYAIYPHRGNWETGKVQQAADGFNSDSLVIKTDNHSGTLKEHSKEDSNKDYAGIALSSEKNCLKVTAVKRSEDGSSIIIRCFNPSEMRMKGTIRSGFELMSAAYARLDETEKESITVTGQHHFDLEAKPKEILTLKIRVKKRNISGENHSPAEMIRQDEYPRNPDFSGYQPMPLVEKKDVDSEKERYECLQNKLEKSKSRREAAKAELEKEGETASRLSELQSMEREVSTLARTSLEALLSIMFTQNRLDNVKEDNTRKQTDELKNKLKEIGLELNMARIRKRTDDYLVNYFNQNSGE